LSASGNTWLTLRIWGDDAAVPARYYPSAGKPETWSDPVSGYSGKFGFVQLSLQFHQLLAISRSVAAPVAALGGVRLRGRREFRISEGLPVYQRRPTVPIAESGEIANLRD